MSAAHDLLRDARGAGDPDARRAAQRRLTQLGSLRVARVLIDGSDADRLGLWREHLRGEAVAAAVVPVLVAALETATAAIAGEALDRVRHRRAADRVDDELLALAELAAVHAAALPLRDLLAVVEWGLTDDAAWVRGPGPVAARFVDAAVRALAAANAAALEEVRWSGGLQRAIALAGDHAGAAALLDRWLADPAAAKVVAQVWFDAHGQLDRHGDHARLVAMIAPAWERATDRAVLAGALGEATARNRGYAGTAGLADWAWARMCDRPDERALVYRAFRGWRDAILERRNATPRARRPGGGSAAEHLAVWGGLDAELLGPTLDEAVRLVRPGDWPALVATMFAIADGATAGSDRVWALVGVGQLGHQLRNRALDRDHEATPDEDAATALWRDRAAALARHLRDEGLVLDRDLAGRADDLEDSVALIDRERARRDDERDDRARRDDEQRRRDDEQRRRDDEQRARDDEAARARAEAEAARARRLVEVAARTAASAHLQPAGPPDPIDREPFFVQLALPTLVDYVRTMVRLQRGADVTALFAELGLDATTWSACVQAWSQLVMRRPDLAQRFATLLSGPWP